MTKLMNFLLLLNFLALLLFPTVNLAADFVGTNQCQTCHEQEYKNWQGSHHDRSMKHASTSSVLANFNDVTFKNADKDNHFYKKGNEFWVNIQGPDGAFHDYQIKYTFGYEPLQQYMVEFEDGRVQLIPFAWDSRAKALGGQRWFNLYPDYTENHQDFFWTNTGQNWNYMCADCHSTNVEKNFNLKTNSYKTTYSEINVGCEACHGPASEHLAWSKNPKIASQALKKSLGFNRNLSKSVKTWVKKEGFNTLKPQDIDHSQQTLVCAQCHSRRTQISTKDHVNANQFGERYMLSLITNDNYYPDGQVYDEVFVYGSFLQSKMNKNGVVCSNCHDPHTAQLTMPEEVVCLQCHQAQTYAQKEHHQHKKDSSGAQCVNCHMPQTTYMEVDKRRDHGWHKPNPAMAQSFGTPDSCLSCHEDKDSQWSSEKVTKWFGKQTWQDTEPFGPIFATSDAQFQNMSQQLSKISQSHEYSDIIRASALARLSSYSDTNSLIAIARNAKHPDTLVKRGAIAGATNIPLKEKWRILSPLLSDPALVVRAEAASSLVSLWAKLTDVQKKALKPALKEYLAIQDYNADRGYAHTNKAIVFGHQQKESAAISAFETSFSIEPYFVFAYVNMAEFYRQRQQNTKAIAVLLRGIKANPDDSVLPYNLGLAYIRDKQTDKAQQYFYDAATTAKTNANYYYVYALSIQATNPKKAEQALGSAYTISGSPQHLYTLCNLQIDNKSFEAAQCIKALERLAPPNVIIELKQKLNAIK